MMDPEVSLLLHCAQVRGLLETQVQVELSERFNRQKHPDLEHHINEIWTDRMSKEPWLFNGAKFRLHSFSLSSTNHPHPPLSSSNEQMGDNKPADLDRDIRNGLLNQPENNAGDRQGRTNSSPHSGPLLTLRLGVTCYKDYLGTNWSAEVAELRRRGEEEFADPLALLAQPLGVGAVLCTDDAQVVFIRRSQKVAEAGGLLDIPGGHPEPKAVCERLGQVSSEEQISVLDMQQNPDAVVSELFSSVCAEIRDEINVPLRFLGPPLLMGIALNNTSAGRPSAEFFVSCCLSSDEVKRLYWKGGAEASESTDVVFLSTTEVLQLSSSSLLWSELCPSAKGAVLLYQTVKPDEETSKKPSCSMNTNDHMHTKSSS